jgi:hypothetical protein
MTWQRRASDGEKICVEEYCYRFLLRFWGFVVPISVSKHAPATASRTRPFCCRIGPLHVASGTPDPGLHAQWLPGGNWPLTTREVLSLARRILGSS